MKRKNAKKRLFFGFEVHSDWGNEEAKGTLIDEKNRHVTLCFLGSHNYQEIEPLLKEIPKPSFLTGFAAVADKIIFLPFSRPRAVSYELRILQNNHLLLDYQIQVMNFFYEKNLLDEKEKRTFLPHLTVARPPFDKKKWQKTFSPFVISLTHLHLYESLGSRQYQPLLTFPLATAFEEIEHKADIAFIVRGQTFKELALNAKAALMSKSLSIESFFEIEKEPFNSIESIVSWLNRALTLQDVQEGSPFKAVSHHGKFDQNDTLLEWEMIVDV